MTASISIKTLRIASMLGAIIFGLCYGVQAKASDLNVQPLAIHLRPGRSSDIITLENRGSVAVRVQVTGFAWDQDSGGKPKLEKSRDLVFFPLLLDIQPGTKRSVRIGLQSVAPVSTERTFRMILEELPSAVSQLTPNASGLIMLSRFSIPVFFDPVKISPKPKAAVGGIQNGVLTLTLENPGNAHYIASDISVLGSDARGTTMFDRSEHGWYVLANGERQYTFQLSRKECLNLHDVTVDLKTSAGSVREKLPLPAVSCAKE